MKVSQLNALAKIAYDKTNPYEFLKAVFVWGSLLIVSNGYMVVSVQCFHDFSHELKNFDLSNWRVLNLDACKDVETEKGYVNLNDERVYSLDSLSLNFTADKNFDYFDKFFQKAPEYAIGNDLSDLFYNPEYLYKLINVFKVFKVLPSITLLDDVVPVYSGQNKNYGIKAILYPARR